MKRKRKENVTNCAFFCSATMLTSKVLPENIENQSEVSGCANSCNVFFQFDLGKPRPMIFS